MKVWEQKRNLESLAEREIKLGKEESNLEDELASKPFLWSTFSFSSVFRC